MRVFVSKPNCPNTRTTLASLFCVILITSVILTACRLPSVDPNGTATRDESKQATVTDVQNTLISATETISPTPTFTPTPEPEMFSQYDLTVLFDYENPHLAVDMSLTYLNKSEETLNEILLVVDANRYAGAFHLQEIAWEDGQVVSDAQLDGIRLSLPLQQPLNPQEEVSLSIAYEIYLPNNRDYFGYTERQANISDWYPYLPPYIPGEGWLARDPGTIGEHLAYDMAGFNVRIKLASPTNPEGLPLVIAASARAEFDGEWYNYRLEPARTFAWTVSHLYQVQQTTVGDTTVIGYAFPNHQEAEDTALRETANSLEVFNELFGPYPYDTLSVVEGDFLNGMEFSGLFYLSHAFYDFYPGNPMGNLTIITAHEVAHQWFYGLVANDQALEPWLDEATTTYSEVLFYEHVYPELVEWWWNNRIYFHQPVGWVDSTIYETGAFYPYRDAVYLRGAMFLQDLRDLIGEEAFFSFWREYVERYSNQLVTGDDFFNLLGHHTSADISGLLAEYFRTR
ncbi:MAG: M1 family metallopeptidase [Anaerolineales bacterium]|nr:M1 family metallopeptidase [Anaerolineales bacterium]